MAIIKVVFSGRGSALPRREKLYASAQEAQAAHWAPIGSGYGHRLYKEARVSGYAADGRNSVEVLQD